MTTTAPQCDERTTEKILMEWIDNSTVTVRGATPAMIVSVLRSAGRINDKYSKARTLGYVVVDQRNTPLEANFRSREDAEDYARDNAERMSRAYRVVEIMEPEG